jgi:hypothetical protein
MASKTPFCGVPSSFVARRTTKVRLRSSEYRAPGICPFLNSLKNSLLSVVRGRQKKGTPDRRSL